MTRDKLYQLTGTRAGCETIAGCLRTLESDIDDADPRELIPNKLYGWVSFLAGLANDIEKPTVTRIDRSDLCLVDHRGDEILLTLAGQTFAISEIIAGVLADALDDAVIARLEASAGE